MKPNPRLIFVLVLLFLAFGIRLATVLVFRDIHQGPVGPISNDDVQFDQIAHNVAEGHGYRNSPDGRPTSFRAPGFPFFLAVQYTLIGTQPELAYLSFCLLGALSCVLTYFLACELLTENGARLAGLFAAVYFPHVYLATLFLSENVFIPCLALGLWLLVRYLHGQGAWTLGAAGLVLGWATLTRPASLLLLPLVLLVLAWSDLRQKRFRPLALLLFTATFLLVIAPWTVRNHQVHGQWILVATNGGSTFWGGNNDLVLNEFKHLGYWVPTTQLPDRDLIDAAPNEAAHDVVEWRLGKQWVWDHLASMPLLEVMKLARLWWLPEYGPGLRWLRIITYVPFLLLFMLAALRCLWRPAFWTPAWQILHVSMLALFITVLVFYGEPRFRDANMPVLMIYAAVGIRPQWRRLERTEDRMPNPAQPALANAG